MSAGVVIGRIIRFVVIGTLSVGGLGLLSFGPRDTEPMPPGRVVVEYWEKWTGYEEQAARAIVNDFNNTIGKEKNIYVRYLSISYVNQKTLVATAGGDPPDIAGLNDWQMSQFAALDAIEPLEGMAAEYSQRNPQNKIDATTYKKVYWDSVNFGGHLYALISTPASLGLLYNKKIFDEAGMTHPPKTIAELDEFARKLDILDQYGRVVRAGTLPQEPGWYLYYLPIWFGGNIWDESTHRFTLTDPRVVKAFDWIQSYARKFGAANMQAFFGSMEGKFDSPNNGFMHGDIVMEMNGPWMANYIYHNNKSMGEQVMPHAQEMALVQAGKISNEERRKNYAWAFAPWPAEEPYDDPRHAVTYCTSDILVIPKGARHKQEAFEFMAYVTRQDVMEKLCLSHCKNSPLTAVSESFRNQHTNPYIDVYEDLASSPKAQFAPRVPIIMEVKDTLDVAIQNLAYMRTNPRTGQPYTPIEALQEAQDQLQAKYDDFAQNQSARHGEIAGAPPSGKEVAR
jgi:ABC-type glycerol-3-phosphate transport system substrate-binding protein